MTLRRRPRAPSPTLPLSPLLPPASRVLACSVAPGFERFPAANVTRFEPRARACAVPVQVSGDVMERMTSGVSAVARASFASCRGLSGQRPGALVLALARVRRNRRRQRRQTDARTATPPHPRRRSEETRAGACHSLQQHRSPHHHHHHHHHHRWAAPTPLRAPRPHPSGCRDGERSSEAGTSSLEAADAAAGGDAAAGRSARARRRRSRLLPMTGTCGSGPVRAVGVAVGVGVGVGHPLELSVPSSSSWVSAPQGHRKRCQGHGRRGVWDHHANQNLHFRLHLCQTLRFRPRRNCQNEAGDEGHVIQAGTAEVGEEVVELRGGWLHRRPRRRPVAGGGNRTAAAARSVCTPEEGRSPCGVGGVGEGGGGGGGDPRGSRTPPPPPAPPPPPPPPPRPRPPGVGGRRGPCCGGWRETAGPWAPPAAG